MNDSELRERLDKIHTKAGDESVGCFVLVLLICFLFGTCTQLDTLERKVDRIDRNTKALQEVESDGR